MEKLGIYWIVLTNVLCTSCWVLTNVLCTSCWVFEPPEPPAGPVDPQSACARACARLVELDCPEGAPEPGLDGQPGTSDDVPCLEWMCAADYLDHEEIASAESCGSI